jgi:PAS domain-containing protein
MAIEVFQGSAIPRDLATAGLEFIWAKWRTLSGTGALSLQRLVEEGDPAIGERCHVLIPAGDDFAYGFVGAALVEFIRPGTAGTVLTRNDTALARAFVEIYRRVLREGAPAFIRFTGHKGSPGTIWHQVVMPVPVSPELTLIVCYSEIISHQIEVYEHLFRTASDAMTVACPITNDAGHVVDGWVLMMNDRAREMLRFDGALGNLRLSDLRQFDGIDLWGRIYAPRHTVTTKVVAARDFDVEILRFPHVFGLRLRAKGVAVIEGPALAPGSRPARINASPP